MSGIKEKKKNGSIFFHILFFAGVFLLTLLQGSFLWAQRTFGNIGIEEIAYTLRMPLEGVNTDFLQDFSETVLFPAALVTWICLAIWRILRTGCAARGRKFFSGKGARIGLRIACMVLFCCWFQGLASAADREYGFTAYYRSGSGENAEEQEFFRREYVDPNDVEIRFPEKKRNLIYILLESGETSNQDVENGGLFEENYIPELTDIARENVSFSRSADKLQGACVARGCSWTIAGMVAQSAGLPLIVRPEDGNDMEKYQYFLPGVTNLGDILEREGYHNCFMIGSDAAFAGRDRFMQQHGNFEIWDYNTAIEKGKIPEDYFVWWGYEDQKLFSYAKEELTRLAQEEEPFAFTMLTADTHHIGGYLCEQCPDTFDKQYANVWACSSRQVNEFVNWIREQPFYENTTIVISGDHLSMDPDFYEDIPNDPGTGRFVYNAILNPAVRPVKEKERDFATLDLFPTTLAAMGVQIEGDRLGLGTNLFSSRRTLFEEYGAETVNRGLLADPVFYNEKFLFE